MSKEENILEAHFRIYEALVFIISCYDINYAYKYINNINKKTFKNYFTVIKTDDPAKINSHKLTVEAARGARNRRHEQNRVRGAAIIISKAVTYLVSSGFI